MSERWHRETPGGFEEAIYFFGAAFFLVDFLVTFLAAFGLVTFLVAFFAVFGAMVIVGWSSRNCCNDLSHCPFAWYSFSLK